MPRDSDHGVPIETPVAGTNKIATTRIEVVDIVRPTTRMAPRFGEGTADDSLVIEETVPMVTGEHRAMPPRDSLEGLEVIDLRMSGMVPIDDRETPSIELAEDLAAVATTSAPAKRPVAVGDATAPLSLSLVEQESMSAIARVNDAVLSGVLDAPVTADTTTESMPRSSPWQAITAAARSLTPVRWWRRRKTSRVKPITP